MATDKFVITKGLDNTFVFTIKADGTTLPMEIVSGDRFAAKLQLLEDGSTAITKLLTPVGDLRNGKVELFLTVDDVKDLVSEKGGKADRYYLKPMYKLVLDCDTTNNGKFIAKVAEVYVD